MRIILDEVIMLDRHRLDGQMYSYLQLFFNSTALRCWSFSEKNIEEKSTCAVFIRIIITCGNQIFL